MAMDSMMEGLEKFVSGSSDIRGVTSDGVNPDESKNKMDKFRSQNGYKNVPTLELKRLRFIAFSAILKFRLAP
jgi:hypothetical protein